MANDFNQDNDLMAEISDGNHDAFAVLYKKYWPLLYLHVYRMLQDERLAEDVVQETFTWLWQNAPLIKVAGHVSSYLYGAVRHNVLNQFRKEKVKSAYLADLSLFVTDARSEVDDVILYKELVREIESEIARMPPRMQHIFNLSRKEMYSHKEIADMLGIAESSVREQIKRALKQLRLALKDRPYLFLAFLHLFR